MIEKFKRLFERFVNRETISYVIFGGLTTVVNFVVYYLFCNILGITTLVANAIAWVAAVVFAYVTNNIWVFQSKFESVKTEAEKIIKFFGARVFSFLIEEAGLLLMVDLAGMNNLIAKLILAVVVVILNYVFSKLFIFNNKDGQAGQK
ncbi:MAG: GtrA family protein [Lachnospiraceae bacterium]|nr:GtrA family protein [Lachnospiraceae bacterium]